MAAIAPKKNNRNQPRAAPAPVSLLTETMGALTLSGSEANNVTQIKRNMAHLAYSVRDYDAPEKAKSEVLRAIRDLALDEVTTTFNPAVTSNGNLTRKQAIEQATPKAKKPIGISFGTK